MLTQEQENMISQGKLDFSNALINFILAHSSLSVFATKLNLDTIVTHTEALHNQISDINKISTEISKISTQTQLLSFNASIEAARAGAAGKSFAVIATEIGSLSKMTKDCTERVDVVNKNTYGKAKDSKDTVLHVQSELQKSSDSTESLSKVLLSRAKIEENGYIITMLAKRLENHADFIRNLITNAGKLERVVDHHNCALGKWYDNNKSKYGSLPEFAAMYDIHKDFHDTAKIFNDTLDTKSILKLVDISHEILHKFLDLESAFEKLAYNDPSYFNI